MTLGAYPLGSVALGVKETSKQTLNINGVTHSHTTANLTLTQMQSLVIASCVQRQTLGETVLSQIHTLTVTNSHHSQATDNATLILVLVIQNSLHGLMSAVAEIFAFMPNPNRTLKAARANQFSKTEAENRTTQPTNNRTFRI